MYLFNKEHPLMEKMLESRDAEVLSSSWNKFALDLLPIATGAQTLVDIGGGDGLFTKLARERGWETTLVEGIPAAITREQERGYDAVQTDLTLGLQGIADNTFDVAICLEVIEHIVTAELLLQEIFRVLKPGGFLLISTPNFAYIMDRLDYLFGREPHEEGFHYRFFTQKKLISTIENAGLTIQERNCIGRLPGINRIYDKVITRGRGQFSELLFRTPATMESWLSRRFVFKAVKQA
jgi:2-polyprenyl-3-methyl-5-hydroxy-6-metoxy-1,4-benzoquinol methylase